MATLTAISIAASSLESFLSTEFEYLLQLELDSNPYSGAISSLEATFSTVGQVDGARI